MSNDKTPGAAPAEGDEIKTTEPVPVPVPTPVPATQKKLEIATTQSGYWRVYVNGAVVPNKQYFIEREAVQDATNILLNDPTANVECRPEFVLRVTPA